MGTDDDGQIERDLLLDINNAPTDPAPRLEYADWLGENHPERFHYVQYLRLVCELAKYDLNDPAREAIQARLGKLSGWVSLAWRAELADAYPEGCAACEFDPKVGTKHCVQPWLSLIPTNDPTIRACQACTSEVLFCESTAEAKREATVAKRKVVLDPAVPRFKGDVPEVPFDYGMLVLAVRQLYRDPKKSPFFTTTLVEKLDAAPAHAGFSSWWKRWFSTERE